MRHFLVFPVPRGAYESKEREILSLALAILHVARKICGKHSTILITLKHQCKTEKIRGGNTYDIPRKFRTMYCGKTEIVHSLDY